MDTFFLELGSLSLRAPCPCSTLGLSMDSTDGLRRALLPEISIDSPLMLRIMVWPESYW